MDESNEGSERDKLSLEEVGEDFVDFYEECEEEVEEEKKDAKEQTWMIGHFKRIFPVKKYDTELPLAASLVYMERRRPLWLPQFTIDKNYFAQASYFADVYCRDQLLKQAVFDETYKPKFGEYAYSISELLSRTYVSKYLKGVHCVRFSPGGKYIVLGCGNGTIQINNTQEKNTSVHCLRGFPRKITSVRFLPGQDEGPFFASSITGRVYLAKQENEEWNCYTLLKEVDNEINAMDLNLDGSFMATAGMDSHIRIYDPQNKKLTQMYLRPGTVKKEHKTRTGEIQDACHFRRICALKYHPKDLNVFITGGWDDLIKVWDVRTSNMPTMTIPGPHLLNNSIDVMGKVILTGQWTCTDGIQLWDMRTTKCLKTVEPTNRPLNYSGQFINDVQFVHSWEEGPIIIPGIIGDMIIAAGTGTRAIEVISIKENMILHRTEESNAVVTLDHNKSLIAYGAVNHLYGIVNFFPFSGDLSVQKGFPDEETAVQAIKHFSSSGNPVGWHEVIIDEDFLEGVKEGEEVKETGSGEGTSDEKEKKQETHKKPTRTGPKTYDIQLEGTFLKSQENDKATE